MEIVTRFFEIGQLPILFMYGLIFFLMGFAILIKATVQSQMILTRHLRTLGLFGIVHSLADWGEMFIPFQKDYFRQGFFIGLIGFKVYLTALSFLILFVFATSLIGDSKNITNNCFRKLPYTVFICWLIIGLILYVYLPNKNDWLSIIEALDRYFIAFPATFFSFIAFYLQKERFVEKSLDHLLPYIYLFAYAFALYSFTQLFPGFAPFKPAVWLNSDVFHKLTGIHIHFFRWIAGLAMTIAAIRILSIFDIEYIERIKENERVRAILVERNRIAMELHDGIIQIIYGLGLQLQKIQLILGRNPSKATLELENASQKVNEAIGQIRTYIMELKDYQITGQNIKELLEEIVNEYVPLFPGEIRLFFEGEFEEIQLNDNEIHNISRIVKQAINNAVRHGKPSKIRINCRVEKNLLLIKIIDNGTGMNTTGENFATMIQNLPSDKQGLKNIQMRAEILNAEIKFDSEPGHGVTISLIIPIQRR